MSGGWVVKGCGGIAASSIHGGPFRDFSSLLKSQITSRSLGRYFMTKNKTPKGLMEPLYLLTQVLDMLDRKCKKHISKYLFSIRSGEKREKELTKCW